MSLSPPSRVRYIYHPSVYRQLYNPTIQMLKRTDTKLARGLCDLQSITIHTIGARMRSRYPQDLGMRFCPQTRHNVALTVT